MSEKQTSVTDTVSRDTFPQKAVVLEASGYAKELTVDPSPPNELLD
mgnify:CR=1 FL=1